MVMIQWLILTVERNHWYQYYYWKAGKRTFLLSQNVPFFRACLLCYHYISEKAFIKHSIRKGGISVAPGICDLSTKHAGRYKIKWNSETSGSNLIGLFEFYQNVLKNRLEKGSSITNRKKLHNMIFNILLWALNFDWKFILYFTEYILFLILKSIQFRKLPWLSCLKYVLLDIFRRFFI